MNPEPPRLIERSLLEAALGHERMFFNLEQAEKIYESLKRNNEADLRA